MWLVSQPAVNEVARDERTCRLGAASYFLLDIHSLDQFEPFAILIALDESQFLQTTTSNRGFAQIPLPPNKSRLWVKKIWARGRFSLMHRFATQQG